MTTDKPTCGICGEPMPAGEEMFKYHGYSGPCPKQPLAKPTSPAVVGVEAMCDEDGEPFTVERLAQWLDAKWERHSGFPNSH